MRKARSKQHLRELIDEEIARQGLSAELNGIDAKCSPFRALGQLTSVNSW